MPNRHTHGAARGDKQVAEESPCQGRLFVNAGRYLTPLPDGRIPLFIHGAGPPDSTQPRASVRFMVRHCERSWDQLTPKRSQRIALDSHLSPHRAGGPLISPESRRSVLPLLLLGGGVLFWGTSFVAAKTALATFTPMTVMWLRMIIATLAFAPFWMRVPRPEYRRGDWKMLLLAAACIPCLYYVLEGYALLFTTSSQAGVISAIVPLLVASGAWVFLHERLAWRSVVAITLSLAGVAALTLGATARQSAPNPLLGNLLELLAMVGAAGSMLAIKHLSTRYDPWLLTGMQAAVGAVFFAPMAFASNPAI